MRTTTTLGASAPGCGGSAHQGVESASVFPIVPSNRSYCCCTDDLPERSGRPDPIFWQSHCQKKSGVR